MSQRARAPWRDVNGTPILLGCRVEQIAIAMKHGALPARVHHQGEVIRRGYLRLYVRFEGETQLVSIRPHLVRVLPPEVGDATC